MQNYKITGVYNKCTQRKEVSKDFTKNQKRIEMQNVLRVDIHRDKCEQ